MFTVNFKRLMSVLHTFRKVLGIGRRKSHHPITFTSSHNCLNIRAKSGDTVIGYEESVVCTGKGEFTTSLSELARLGCPSRNVAFIKQQGQVSAQWEEAGRSITRGLEVLTNPEFPAGTIILHTNGTELAKTLWQAASLTDPESKRYSIGCLRLRSTDGQIAATDGRQAFV